MKIATLICFSVIALALAPDAMAEQCKPFHAEVMDTRATPCPTFFCTTGTIDGNHGLNGTIDAVLDSYALGPSTTPEPSRTISFSSQSVTTTVHGSLTARETGISSTGAVNPSRRFFAGFGEFIAGTGEYAGATGRLMFAGRLIDGINITDTMVGEICLP